MISSKKISSLFLTALLLPLAVYAESAPWVGNSLNGNRCDGGNQGYGPFDYTRLKSIDHFHLEIVESHHFIPNVENLIKGSEGSIEGDLNYTLRAWPNHPRALLSIIKYQLNIKDKLMVGKLNTPPECYLQRAIHFSPHDSVSYSLYGYYLRKMGLMEEAVKQYEKALEIDPENAKHAYSYSLLLIDLRRYDDAVKYAKIAYQNKTTPVQLKRKLEKLGVWNK